jgi:hypothetical protein
MPVGYLRLRVRVPVLACRVLLGSCGFKHSAFGYGGRSYALSDVITVHQRVWHGIRSMWPASIVVKLGIWKPWKSGDNWGFYGVLWVDAGKKHLAGWTAADSHHGRFSLLVTGALLALRRCVDFHKKKEEIEPAVGTVAVGKVEIGRKTMLDAGLRGVRDLEIWTVELRGSGIAEIWPELELVGCTVPTESDGRVVDLWLEMWRAQAEVGWARV